MLHCRIIMGYVDYLCKLNLSSDLADNLGKNLLHPLHHQLSVCQGKVHAILHLLEIILSFLAVQGQKGQLPLLRHRGMPFPVQLNSQLVIMMGHLIAEVTTPRVDHQPDKTVAPLLDLKEMIASSKVPTCLSVDRYSPCTIPSRQSAYPSGIRLSSWAFL
ncbi:hypothetical protein H206_00095 [Candidatus Electrothrix aarhusensis]|uniref:Uncharacterized protein n=1 Tax=Candidatus Electrothrix aarhusensis TaxID=1859131 RepID=A0A444IZG0_9BACT|nr:hypothetical protein H206_00095 [Candidatus Electrothrix aarhusensis]